MSSEADLQLISHAFVIAESATLKSRAAAYASTRLPPENHT